MKTKETKFESPICFGPHHLFRAALCLAVILICSSASAQNLFVSGNNAGGGKIFEFTPDGMQSTFASGLMGAAALAFDSAGNLFVADVSVDSNSRTSGTIYKFTPAGVRSTFALGLNNPLGLAFDSAGNLFVSDDGDGTIYKFTPQGARSTFASGLSTISGLAFDSVGNLFVSADYDAVTQGVAKVYKFTPRGMRTTFASGFTGPWSLAFDNAGNLWVADVGDIDGFGTAIYKVTPQGKKSTFLSWPQDQIVLNGGLAFDAAGNLFVTDYISGILKFASSGVRSTLAPTAGVYELAFQPAQASPTPTPLPTPTPTPPFGTPTPIPSPARPAVSLKASPANVNKGGTASFTASASMSDPSAAIVVNFSTSGNAVNGNDYSLSANQITIPTGQSSGSVTFHVTTTKTKGKEKVTMTLESGTGYTVATKNKANFAKIIIHNK